MTELRRELRHDAKVGLILTSIIVPFPFLGLCDAPLWAWAIYFGWIGLFIVANRPRGKKSKPKAGTFEHFEIGEEDKAA